MPRRTTFVALAFVLLFSSRLCAAEKPTNFILIMCDDLGWGDVGFNGNTTIKTPHLDAMARNSLKFNRFYAASAVCSPTRGSVVTGRHPFRYGIPTANAGHMKAEELTLAELLKQCGYRTGHFGKWHLGTLSRTARDSNRGGPKGLAHYSPPWKNGFDVCFSTEAKTPTWDPMRKPKGKASKNGWDYLTPNDKSEPYGTFYWNERGKMVNENLHGDDSRVIMDRAAPFIEQATKDETPFFAIIWFHTPHLPVVAGPKHAAMYSGFESYPKNYFGCITAMDEQIGRLRALLRDRGAAENTFIAFCSDNGPEGSDSAPGSAGPYRGRKRDLYEGGVRVPGLIEWPAVVSGGGVTSYPAVTSDYLPTIAAIVAAEQPTAPKLEAKRPIDGLDLASVLRDPKLEQRSKPIGFQFAGKWAWNDNRFKLVYYPAPKRRKKSKTDSSDSPRSKARAPMLFDLLEDPGETTDLAAKMPERVKRMEAEFRKWQTSCANSAKGADYK